jgi:hypothetical protein
MRTAAANSWKRGGNKARPTLYIIYLSKEQKNIANICKTMTAAALFSVGISFTSIKDVPQVPLAIIQYIASIQLIILTYCIFVQHLPNTLLQSGPKQPLHCPSLCIDNKGGSKCGKSPAWSSILGANIYERNNKLCSTPFISGCIFRRDIWKRCCWMNWRGNKQKWPTIFDINTDI